MELKYVAVKVFHRLFLRWCGVCYVFAVLQSTEHPPPCPLINFFPSGSVWVVSLSSKLLYCILHLKVWKLYFRKLTSFVGSKEFNSWIFVAWVLLHSSHRWGWLISERCPVYRPKITVIIITFNSHNGNMHLLMWQCINISKYCKLTWSSITITGLHFS